MVDNIREATEAIRASVEKAERASGTRILSAHVGLSGAHVQSVNNRGIVAVPDRNRPISGDDIARALEGAKIISIPTNREILHVLPRYYIVDGQDSVSDPLGMYGQRLDVEAHIITVASSAIANVIKVVEAAGVQVDDARPPAPRQRRGGAHPRREAPGRHPRRHRRRLHRHQRLHRGQHPPHGDAAHRRQPHHARPRRRPALPLPQRRGGQGASTATPCPAPSTREDMIDIEAFGAERQRQYPRRLVCEIIQARCEEILEMIVTEVRTRDRASSSSPPASCSPAAPSACPASTS